MLTRLSIWKVQILYSLIYLLTRILNKVASHPSIQPANKKLISSGKNEPTNKLTPWSTVLPGKPKGPQPVKKFPAFYGTRRLITTFTSTRQLSLSWLAKPIHAKYFFWSVRFKIYVNSRIHILYTRDTYWCPYYFTTLAANWNWFTYDSSKHTDQFTHSECSD